MEISIAHSPDSDDAFMFYGLATNKVRVPGYRFTHTLSDIETLNRRAREEAFYDVTAISFHAYPYLQENYTLMGCGGSVGEGYGPMIVSKSQADARRPGQDQDRCSRDAHHGLSRAQDLQSGHRNCDVPFDQHHPRDSRRKLRRRPHHPRRPAHLFHQRPLQGDRPRRLVARNHRPGAAAGRQRDSPLARAPKRTRSSPRHCAISIQHALEHREQALEYAMQFARDLDTTHGQPLCEHVRERAHLDYGPDGREAIRKLLDMGLRARHHPHRAEGGFRRLRRRRPMRSRGLVPVSSDSLSCGGRGTFVSSNRPRASFAPSHYSFCRFLNFF